MGIARTDPSRVADALQRPCSSVPLFHSWAFLILLGGQGDTQTWSKCQKSKQLMPSSFPIGLCSVVLHTKRLAQPIVQEPGDRSRAHAHAHAHAHLRALPWQQSRAQEPGLAGILPSRNSRHGWPDRKRTHEGLAGFVRGEFICPEEEAAGRTHGACLNRPLRVIAEGISRS